MFAAVNVYNCPGVGSDVLPGARSGSAYRCPSDLGMWLLATINYYGKAINRTKVFVVILPVFVSAVVARHMKVSSDFLIMGYLFIRASLVRVNPMVYVTC